MNTKTVAGYSPAQVLAAPSPVRRATYALTGPAPVALDSDARRYSILSRAMDVLLSAAALVVFAPIMLLAATLIRLTSRGGAIFRQPRAGLGGRPFTMFKLRTMYSGADDDKELFRGSNALRTGPSFKMKNDPRVTRVGRWLRQLSIDELPQFYNVLRGDMAMVGPRPVPLDEVRTDTAPQRVRLTVKPGITCLWQVSGRTEIPYEEWLALDVWYIRNRSLSSTSREISVDRSVNNILDPSVRPLSNMYRAAHRYTSG